MSSLITPAASRHRFDQNASRLSRACCLTDFGVLAFVAFQTCPDRGGAKDFREPRTGPVHRLDEFRNCFQAGILRPFGGLNRGRQSRRRLESRVDADDRLTAGRGRLLGRGGRSRGRGRVERHGGIGRGRIGRNRRIAGGRQLVLRGWRRVGHCSSLAARTTRQPSVNINMRSPAIGPRARRPAVSATPPTSTRGPQTPAASPWRARRRA